VAEAAAVGSTQNDQWRRHLHPAAADVPLDPLMPLKIGHMNSVIAAGHLILPQNQTIFRYSGPRFPGQRVYADKLPDYLTKFLARHPHLEWHHRSLDADIPLCKEEWRRASPLVEAFTLGNREPELIPLPAPASPPPAARPDCRLIMTG
jgi:hypothetical protein